MKNKVNFIKKNHEFQEIIKNKNQLINREYIFFFFKNEKNYTRFGLSVGKKIGNAVLRNKIKRQLRHMLQNYSLENNSFFNQSFDLIILVRKKYLDNSFELNKKTLFHLFGKVIKTKLG